MAHAKHNKNALCIFKNVVMSQEYRTLKAKHRATAMFQ